MKRILSLILAAAITISMVSCSESGSGNQSGAETINETSSSADFGTINLSGLSSFTAKDTSYPSKKGSNSSVSVEYVEDMVFSNEYKYSGYLKNGKPNGYGCLKLSDDKEATCSNWVDGTPNGTVWQCVKGNKRIDYRESTMVNGVETGECNILCVYYTDNEYKNIDKTCFTSGDMVNGKLNGDVVSYVVLNDSLIAIGTTTAKNGELNSKWNCVFTDGEKILDEKELDIDGNDKQGGFLSKVKGMISKLANVAKVAFSKVKNAIVNVVDKIKGLSPSQKERVKKVSKFLVGQYIDNLGNDDEAARKFKEKHPIKSAIKELYNTFTTIKEAKEAFLE